MSERSPAPDDPGSRLDNISTRHSLLEAARAGPPASAQAARQALVMRYNRAVRRYLGALLRDDHDVDEVAQEVVVKILRGDFSGVDSARGRFRSYLKAAVRNAAFAHLRKRPSGQEDLERVAGSEKTAEEEWGDAWKRSLLEGALRGLKAHQQAHPGNLFATLVEMLHGFPDDDSEQLAARVGERLGRPIRADAVRKQVSRARRKFAELLVEEVRGTLDDPAPGALEEELAEVGLLGYVRDFFPRWREA